MGKGIIFVLYCVCCFSVFGDEFIFKGEQDYRRIDVFAEGRDNSALSGHEDSGVASYAAWSGYNGVSVVRGGLFNNGYSSVFNGDLSTSTVADRRNLLPTGTSPISISKYISYKEATYSNTAVAYGIKNTPDSLQLINMRNLGVGFFDRVREHYHTPIYISSFFRSRELNKIVGGALFSDHLANNGLAAIDIDMDGRYGPTNNKLFFFVKDNMSYYKLIAEFPSSKGQASWVHVAYSTSTVNNSKKHVFIAIMKNKRKVYLPYNGNEYLLK